MRAFHPRFLQRRRKPAVPVARPARAFALQCLALLGVLVAVVLALVGYGAHQAVEALNYLARALTSVLSTTAGPRIWRARNSKDSHG